MEQSSNKSKYTTLFCIFAFTLSTTFGLFASDTKKQKLAVSRQLDKMVANIDHIGQMEWNRAFAPNNPQLLPDLQTLRKSCITNKEISATTESELVELASTINHDLKTFNQGFDKQQFDFSAAVVKPDKSAQLIIEENEQLLVQMTSLSRSAGLSFGNKTVRFFDDLAVRWNAKRWAKRVAAWGSLAFLAKSLCSDNSRDLSDWGRKVASRIYYGKAPVTESSESAASGTETATASSEALKASVLKYAWNELPKKIAGENLGASALVAATVGEDLTDIWNWTKEKWNIAHRHLKGGHFVPPISRANKPLFNFDHVVGFDLLKADVETVIRFAIEPELFSRPGLPIPIGYIFAGPPMSGKSYFAHCLTGQINKRLEATGQRGDFSFMEVHASEIVQNGLDSVFADALKYAPCVLCIKEIEMLHLSSNTTLAAQLLDKLEASLDPDRKRQVVVVATTNKSKSIEEILKAQPKRFTKKINFYRPCFADRTEFFRRALDGRNLDPAEFNLDSLAEDTAGFSYGKISNLFSKCLIRATKKNVAFTQKFIDETFDVKIRYIIAAPLTIPEEQVDLITSYLAGQAVVHEVLQAPGDLVRLTNYQVMKEKQYGKGEKPGEDDLSLLPGKLFLQEGRDRVDIETGTDFVKMAKVNLAGMLSQQLLLGQADGYRIHERTEAFETARCMAFEGIDMDCFSKDQMITFNEKAWEIFKKWESEVNQLLEKHKPQIAAVAQALKQKNKLNGSQVKEIIADNPVFEALRAEPAAAAA